MTSTDLFRNSMTVPEELLETLNTDLTDHFPWDNWEKYIKDILVGGKTPIGMSSDERIRYYLVVLETISRGHYDLLPFIANHGYPTDVHGVFSKCTLGLDPKGKNEDMVAFTAARLKRVFQKVSVLDQVHTKDWPHLVLTSRDPRAFYNDFPGALETSCQDRLPPILFQVPVVAAEEEVVTPKDGFENAVSSAFTKAVKSLETVAGEIEKSFKAPGEKGQITQFRIERKDGQAPQLFRVEGEELDIRTFEEFSDGLLLPTLFPDSLCHVIKKDIVEASKNKGLWSRLSAKNGWMVEQSDSLLFEAKLIGACNKIKQVIENGIPYPSEEKKLSSRRIYDFALNALAIEVLKRDDHPKLRHIRQGVEIHRGCAVAL